LVKSAPVPYQGHAARVGRPDGRTSRQWRGPWQGDESATLVARFCSASMW
jgi:hypothetical protein